MDVENSVVNPVVVVMDVLVETLVVVRVVVLVDVCVLTVVVGARVTLKYWLTTSL